MTSLLAVLIGTLAARGFYAVLSKQGADTPARALLAGGLAVGFVIVAQVRPRGECTG